MNLRPITLAEARRYVAEVHRHNDPPQGWIVGVGIERDGQLTGVGILGRPVGRGSQDGRTAEITRVATEGDRNACSFLYGALCRVAAGLGYSKVITYTLAEEPGTSLLAAGFELDAELQPRPAWDYTGQARYQTDLFGNERRPAGAKKRWVRHLRQRTVPRCLADELRRASA